MFKGDDGEKFERNWLYWTGDTNSKSPLLAFKAKNSLLHVYTHIHIYFLAKETFGSFDDAQFWDVF